MYSSYDTCNASEFPHSEISGSKGISASPELIAAYYVLHRLLTPRHPSNALIILNLALEFVTIHRIKTVY
jgi:hypothetical protein